LGVLWLGKARILPECGVLLDPECNTDKMPAYGTFT
jgi:hypothetical protein